MGQTIIIVAGDPEKFRGQVCITGQTREQLGGPAHAWYRAARHCFDFKDLNYFEQLEAGPGVLPDGRSFPQRNSASTAASDRVGMGKRMARTMSKMNMQAAPDIKKKLLEAVAYLLENDPRWPATLRKPTREESLAISQVALVAVGAFAEWVEEKMKAEVAAFCTGMGTPPLAGVPVVADAREGGSSNKPIAGANPQGNGTSIPEDAAKLAEHWLWEMECDHEEKRDKAKCACGWVSDWLPSVGDAALAWAKHALEETK